MDFRRIRSYHSHLRIGLIMIREYHEQTNRAIIRNNNYSSSIESILSLYEEALKDFDSLKPGDVEIVHYGGIYYKGTFGIEFHAPKKPDQRYFRISFLEDRF